MNNEILNVDLPNGRAIVFSDAHYWPGVVSRGHVALLDLLADLSPDLVIANGDIFDGARISRHARIGWEHAPKPAEELAVCSRRLGEIFDAASGCEQFIWPLGNHDARFETFLSNHAGEYIGVPGFSLKDHFPAWRPCWACNINGNTVVKHRWNGGKNATLRNTIESGTSIVTGHLHALRVTPFSDYNGTRFGVDCGTLAEPYGPQFTAYTEMNPVDWRTGFVVLTFENGKLLWPEVCHVDGRTATFRGRNWRV